MLTLETVLKSLSEEARAVIQAALAKGKGSEPNEDDALPDAVKKRLAIEKAERERIQKQLDAEIEKSETRDAIEKARTSFAKLGKPEDVGPLLRKIRKTLTTEDADAVEALLTKANAAQVQAEKTLGTSIGKRGGTDNASESAYEKLAKRAKEMVSKGQAPTFEQAMVKAVEAHPELAEQYEAEQNGED